MWHIVEFPVTLLGLEQVLGSICCVDVGSDEEVENTVVNGLKYGAMNDVVERSLCCQKKG